MIKNVFEVNNGGNLPLFLLTLIDTLHGLLLVQVVQASLPFYADYLV